MAQSVFKYWLAEWINTIWQMRLWRALKLSMSKGPQYVFWDEADSDLLEKHTYHLSSSQFSSVAESCPTATPWTATLQVSLSITNSWSLLKLMFIELVLPSNHLILCRPLLLLLSSFPSMRVFSNESILPIRWPKYWSFSFSISPSNEYSGLISFRMDWSDRLAV